MSLNTVNIADSHVVNEYVIFTYQSCQYLMLISYIIVNAREVYTLDESTNMVVRGGTFGNVNVRVQDGIVTCIGSTA